MTAIIVANLGDFVVIPALPVQVIEIRLMPLSSPMTNAAPAGHMAGFPSRHGHRDGVHRHCPCGDRRRVKGETVGSGHDWHRGELHHHRNGIGFGLAALASG